ncbi:uncharacterized protein [Musca autumnalis]|uniref:uncharacterized protein n=1 Tax=Musca autumnalis TaxID=221902 RepID=UPI003CF84374
MTTRSGIAYKRNWPLHFDTNPEQHKIKPKKKKMNELSSEPVENSGQFIDLSATIINRPGQGNMANQPHAASTGAENEGDNFLTPGTRRNQPRDVDLEERMKNIVSSEVNDIRKTLDTLIKTVQNLAVNTASKVVSFEDRSKDVDVPQPEHPAVSNQRLDRDPLTSGTPSSSGGYVPPSFRMEPLRIRVDKFGINFDGNPLKLTVEEFIFRLECLQEQYDIPWDEILRDFRLLISGPVLEWFWQAQKMRKFTLWIRLKDALLSQYRTTKSPWEAMRDLVERKQMANETIDAYFHVMGKLRSRLHHPITDEDMIKIIKSNVRENIKMVIYPMSIATVELLRVECKDAEKNFPRKDPRPMTHNPRPSRPVNEVTYEGYEDYDYDVGDESDPQVDLANYISAMRVNLQSNKAICWNCHVPGHVFIDCPSTERTVFCYKCGKPKVITPTCPNCQSGNRRRGVEASGETRPAENPTK